jgi:hypothetical protein
MQQGFSKRKAGYEGNAHVDQREGWASFLCRWGYPLAACIHNFLLAREVIGQAASWRQSGCTSGGSQGHSVVPRMPGRPLHRLQERSQIRRAPFLGGAALRVVVGPRGMPPLGGVVPQLARGAMAPSHLQGERRICAVLDTV